MPTSKRIKRNPRRSARAEAKRFATDLGLDEAEGYAGDAARRHAAHSPEWRYWHDVGFELVRLRESVTSPRGHRTKYRARSNPPKYSLWEVLDSGGHVAGWEVNLTEQGAIQEVASRHGGLHLGHRVLTQLPLQDVMLFVGRHSQRKRPRRNPGRNAGRR